MIGTLCCLLILSHTQTDVDARDAAGRSPLMLAAMADEAGEVERLLDAGASVDLVDDQGWTALLYAAQHSIDSVRRLIAAGAKLEHRDELGTSALSIAIESGRDDVAAVLRDAGLRESLEELLDAAVRAGDRAELTRLIASGADVDALDTGSYQTPLMTAIEGRRLEVLLVLLEAGADPTVDGTGFQTTGENAITFAARQGSPWVLRRLLARSARRTDVDRATLAGCAHRDVLAVLFEAGGRVDYRGPEGSTPLICAASAGAADAVSYLLEEGANPDLRTDDGRTALDWAVQRGHHEVVATLGGVTGQAKEQR